MEIRAAFGSGYAAPLLVLPTGGGKTVCFSYIAKGAMDKGKRVLLLAHRRELVSQISAALRRWGADHGLVTPQAPPTDHPVQVAMAQTLVRRIKLDRDGRHRYDLVIIDEAHHATRDSTWGAILDHNAGAKLLGVTATPCRLDGKGLGVAAGGFFDVIVEGPTVEDLIARGRLAQPVVFAPEFRADLAGVKKRGGDFQAQALGEAMDKRALTGDAVAHYRAKCGGAPAIAFTVTIDHAHHVAEQFREEGYSAAVLTGSTPDREREQMIHDLGAGALNVLCSCNVVSEGTDIPAVAAAILLRPTASFALCMQQMGRALRIAAGKDKAIILDHAGNTLRHGLPTDAVEWSLDSAKRKGQGVKDCPGCGASVPKPEATCPHCGHVFFVAAPAGREDGDEEQDDLLPPWQPGELVEMTPELMAERRRWKWEQMRRARSLEDYRKIAQAMGYKPGWAYHRYQETAQQRGA